MRYRRCRQPGGCYFFTVVTYRRKRILTNEENVTRLRMAFLREKANHPFDIDAIVVLPDHIHAIWTLPSGDVDYSGRWNRIKRYFSVGVVDADSAPSQSRLQKREKAVWQRRFWEHTIRDEEDWRLHMDYIHYNPVKHGLVDLPGLWPYSSFGRCVKKGWYDPNWGSTIPESIRDMEYE